MRCRPNPRDAQARPKEKRGKPPNAPRPERRPRRSASSGSGGRGENAEALEAERAKRGGSMFIGSDGYKPAEEVPLFD